MADAVSVRPAIREDHAALEMLLRRASLMWEEYREVLLAHPEALQLPLEQIEAGGVYVAEERGEIVGLGILLLRQDGDADLDGLFVDPARWKQGIGRRLVQEAERRACSANARILYVVANPRSEGFYAACAFEKSARKQPALTPPRSCASG